MIPLVETIGEVNRGRFFYFRPLHQLNSSLAPKGACSYYLKSGGLALTPLWSRQPKQVYGQAPFGVLGGMMANLFHGAHQAVSRAIKAGKLPPIDSVICADCGEKPAEEYHHYNGHEKEHWLDVTPLCLSCHGKTRQVPKEQPRCYQCEALANNRKRCTNWAMKDSMYCAGHAKQAKNLIHFTEAIY